MLLTSTRNPDRSIPFSEAIFVGLAPDGGLFYPSKTIDLEFEKLQELKTFNEIAAEVSYLFLKDELDREGAKRIVENAFHFLPELKRLNENIHVLELFHGDTSAFKDFGASFLASSMEEFLKGKKDRAVILTATSGDTGSAVARAFHHKENIDVVILYPSGRVSPLQEKQLTTLGDNIHTLEVKGSFDDCQKMVKEAFQNEKLKAEFSLTSANSINIGRLFPQSFYYIWSQIQLSDWTKNPVFTVPSGNFGNLTAGLYAKSWGLPVKRFIAATNENDVVPEYLNQGNYSPRPSIQTYSNAMDVGAPSNFERMEELFKKNLENFRDQIWGIGISDEETDRAMKKIYKDFHYISCPHTAVGIEASLRYLEKNPDDKIITLSTAHPGKFLEVTEKILGIKADLPESLSSLKDKVKKAEMIGTSPEELESFLRKSF